MKILLFCGQRNVFSVSRKCAEWLLAWLPQRQKLNRLLYDEISGCIKGSEGDIVILKGENLDSMRVRSHPVIIEGVVKFSEPGYRIEEDDCRYYSIRNFGTRKEALSVPKGGEKFTRGLKQTQDTYHW